MRYKLIWLAVIVGIVLAGGWFGLQQRSVTIPADLYIMRTSTGGFAGDGDGANVTIANDQLTTSTTQRQLTQDELKDIVQRINKANFFAQQSSAPNQCSDGFITNLQITMNSKTHQVTFDDCSGIPYNLMRLNDGLKLLL